MKEDAEDIPKRNPEHAALISYAYAFIAFIAEATEGAVEAQ